MCQTAVTEIRLELNQLPQVKVHAVCNYKKHMKIGASLLC